jgi:hypothetical protein
MSNRIVQLQVRDHSLDPAQAELSVAVEAEHVTPTTELRGRLIGPRCLYAATVEVAYPLRPLTNRLERRVVLPEPCLWEPQCPFLYQGSVQLWEDGQRCDQVEVWCGLRRILLVSAGLRVNGRPLLLRGRMPTACDEAELSGFRRHGCNLLLAPPEAPPALWDLADRHGFFVLARMPEPSAGSLADAERQSAHSSSLGWLLEPPLDRWNGEFVKRLGFTRTIVGVELADGHDGPLPEGITFIACSAGALANAQASGLPVLLLGGPDLPGMFGRVD